MTISQSPQLAAHTSASTTISLFKNLHVLTGAFPNAFTAHYLLERDEANRPVITLNDDCAGIVMSKSGDYHAWMKSEFQALAKADAPAALLAQARADFGVLTDEEMRKTRTVGCGTNVIALLTDGPHYISVKRTAPKATDAGSVNPDAHTRAAGGSTGDIDLTALRELNEELFIIANIGGMHSIFHILPEAYLVNQVQERAILNLRRDRVGHILDSHGRSEISLRNHFEMRTPCIAVEGLTEDIVERRNFGDKILKDRVFADSPNQMDVNGIDAITVLDLRAMSVSSKDIVGVFDGETNQKGELLKRNWAVSKLDDIHARLIAKEITMSPAPSRVVMNKDRVIAAVHTRFGL